MDRKQHWESVYTGKSMLEVSWYQGEPQLSLELIAASGVGPDGALIDVGGGASLLVDRLLERGFRRVAVLDLSARALAYTRERLGTRADAVEWHEADITRFRPPHRYDLWHDRAVFHFLTDPADRRAYVEALSQALAPGGQVIIAAFALGGPLKCSGLDIVQYDSTRLLHELGPGFRLLEERSEMHLTPTGKQQAFGFFRLARV